MFECKMIDYRTLNHEHPITLFLSKKKCMIILTTSALKNSYTNNTFHMINSKPVMYFYRIWRPKTNTHVRADYILQTTHTAF